MVLRDRLLLSTALERREDPLAIWQDILANLELVDGTDHAGGVHGQSPSGASVPDALCHSDRDHQLRADWVLAGERRVMVELIAEVASSHGGDRGLMEAFIAQCADAGATFVKFQSYQVATLRPNDPQREWLAKAELSDEDHHFLIETCAKYHVKFLTTIFHHSRVPFLATLGLEAIKIGSAEVLEPSMAAVDGAFPRVIASLGVDDLGFVSPVVTAQRHWLRCVSRYPAPRWMCKQHHYPQVSTVRGWSDHCIGVGICKRAIVHGATIIEKHVQIEHQARPGRPWEATMSELQQIRQFADADPESYRGRWQHGG